MPENASLAGDGGGDDDGAIDSHGAINMHDLASPRFTPTIQCRREGEPARRTSRRVQLVAAPAVVGRDWQPRREMAGNGRSSSVWLLLLPLLAVAVVGSWLAP